MHRAIARAVLAPLRPGAKIGVTLRSGDDYDGVATWIEANTAGYHETVPPYIILEINDGRAVVFDPEDIVSIEMNE